jgi:hypothetical protein
MAVSINLQHGECGRAKDAIIKEKEKEQMSEL